MELLQDLLNRARKLMASDIHLTADEYITLRIDGKLHLTELFVTKEQANKILQLLLSETQQKVLNEEGSVDLAYLDGEGLSYRINASKSNGRLFLVIRIINKDIPTCEELLIPQAVQAFTSLKQGMVLVCGATGSGKSTTLAALIEKINRERRVHIVTLEDPIEYKYENKKALIHQREVGRDTKSFACGLRSALRQDPDVILVGELRDRETTTVALIAAETGHLVLTTLHTNDAVGAVNRILDLFGEERQLVRSQLSEVLQGIICQELISRAMGNGRVANFEVLSLTPALRSLIREGRIHQISSYLQTGRQQGMLTKSEHRKLLVEKGII
ncbi:MAG: PilT/PilU family type 4a pilus ATPase [Phascolarctobacterium sp.]|nr:PilT/PilU family type 4a pilus ATPase [Phascolarctobacterium sp.]